MSEEANSFFPYIFVYEQHVFCDTTQFAGARQIERINSITETWQQTEIEGQQKIGIIYLSYRSACFSKNGRQGFGHHRCLSTPSCTDLRILCK